MQGLSNFFSTNTGTNPTGGMGSPYGQPQQQPMAGGNIFQTQQQQPTNAMGMPSNTGLMGNNMGMTGATALMGTNTTNPLNGAMNNSLFQTNQQQTQGGITAPTNSLFPSNTATQQQGTNLNFNPNMPLTGLQQTQTTGVPNTLNLQGIGNITTPQQPVSNLSLPGSTPNTQNNSLFSNGLLGTTAGNNTLGTTSSLLSPGIGNSIGSTIGGTLGSSIGSTTGGILGNALSNSIGGTPSLTNTTATTTPTVPAPTVDLTKSRYRTTETKPLESIKIVPDSIRMKQLKKKEDIVLPSLVGDKSVQSFDKVFDLEKKRETINQPIFSRKFSQAVMPSYRSNGIVPMIRPNMRNSAYGYDQSQRFSMQPTVTNQYLVQNGPRMSVNMSCMNQNVGQSVLGMSQYQQANTSYIGGQPCVIDPLLCSVDIDNVSMNEIPFVTSVLGQFGYITDIVPSRRGLRVVFADQSVAKHVMLLKTLTIAGRTCNLYDPNTYFFTAMMEGNWWKGIFGNFYNFLRTVWN
ncbi:hypothetical protein EIN_058400 [Entamoeba invadens IP1]|uniref:hypothetical protein n=1 Tax=Entamoeba invadens IP1 TaxID=370355 RepID=UPI0002C3DFAE|nr:hypothetical protein EIN_058400 [Entamoeba invadens IP1]ELP93395.1 hypothetical protein EIN_058400 [Entamoeba invadens IP1]|eukprot:XP_004260166.1 hypothetical protein EIN_058400 [Entamoeba invadens IP1]